MESSPSALNPGGSRSGGGSVTGGGKGVSGGVRNSLGESEVPVIEDPDDGIVRRTKRRFKEEYLRRKMYRDDVVAKVLERERRIAKINVSLDQLLTELFYVSLFDQNAQCTRVLPILGVSYPKSGRSILTQVCTK